MKKKTNKNSIERKSEKIEQLTMWHAAHDLSATQMHPAPIAGYQHYSTAQSHHRNGINKWNLAGQRSSYSLPHSGYIQNNMRWQKHDEKNPMQPPPPPPLRHLSNSTRNLSATPLPLQGTPPPPPSVASMHTFDTRLIYNNGNGIGGVGVGRPRPASMYDVPKMMTNLPVIGYHHQNGFIPTKGTKNHHQRNDITSRQSPSEMVRINDDSVMTPTSHSFCSLRLAICDNKNENEKKYKREKSTWKHRKLK